MYTLTTPVLDDLDAFCSVGGHSLDADTVRRQRPERISLLADESGQPVARCSLWWTETPSLDGRRLGYIGHFAATDADGSVDLLNRACGELAGQGCTLAVGPIDGNTWQRYRFITERGDEPRFFLEPDNPDEWPEYFRQAGFTPLAEYHSALNTDLTARDERIALKRQSLREEGITLRTLDMDHFDRELRRLHTLSLVGFRDNFLYTPISEEEFLAQYIGIRPHVRPEFVILAEKANRLIGFIFAIPDLYQAARGVRIDTAIVKTMAVHPDHAGKGLGGLLMDLAHQAIHQAGYARVIHALMHVDNRSGQISKHTARTFRRYTLFAKPIGQP